MHVTAHDVHVTRSKNSTNNNLHPSYKSSSFVKLIRRQCHTVILLQSNISWRFIRKSRECPVILRNGVNGSMPAKHSAVVIEKAPYIRSAVGHIRTYKRGTRSCRLNCPNVLQRHAREVNGIMYVSTILVHVAEFLFSLLCSYEEIQWANMSVVRAKFQRVDVTYSWIWFNNFPLKEKLHNCASHCIRISFSVIFES